MKYPIGIQSFDRLREDGFVYVDKTALVYNLVQTGSIYFLSRPRRFGKSLLVSTLACYFQGRKELFDGLAIADLEKDWLQYPIFRIDFNGGPYTQPGVLEATIEGYLGNWEDIYGKNLNYTTTGDRFKELLRRAYERTGQRAVVLIDEYDKPILDVLDTGTYTCNHVGEKLLLEDHHREILKSFYSTFKGADEYLKFVLLTGVTKFSQVSVFSGFNQPKDISMDERYESLCGITQEELEKYFAEPISRLATKYECTVEEMKDWLKRQYDGYHFSTNMAAIYNPFSILNAFDMNEIRDYWFATGTPTYLIRLLQHSREQMNELTGKFYDPTMFIDYKADVEQPLPMIFQSGYLTIKDYEPEFKIYRLGFPNQEVEEGFMKYLLPFYTNIQASKSPFEIGRFVREVRAGDYDAFFHRLQSFFADTSYEAIIGRNPERDTELHYRNVLFIVFKLVGLYTQVEYHTSNGRIDLVLQTDRYVYIMEFKLNGTAEEALRQIEEKGYALPFAGDDREVLKIGANFSSETRNIERWLVG